MKDDNGSYIHNLCSCEKKAWKKIPARTGFVPLTSAIPVHQYRRGQRVRIPYKPEFFSGFLFPAVKVVHITAMIILHLSVFVFVVVLFCLFVCLFFFLWNRNVLGFHVMKESEPNCKTSHRNFNSLSDETHGKSELTVHKQSRGYKRNKKKEGSKIYKNDSFNIWQSK